VAADAGIQPAGDDLLEQGGERRVGVEAALEVAAHPRGADGDHLVAQVAPTPLVERALLLDERAVGGELLEQLLHALPRSASVRTMGTRQAPARPVARTSTPRTSRTIVSVSGWSALLTTMTSGISMIPAFSAWMESPEPGMRMRTTVSAWSITSISAWPTPDRLQEDVLLARGVHEQRGLQRRLAEAAERPAVGHGADEHARIEEVLGQPDAVAEQRAVGERRARVDGQHRHLAVLGPAELRQRADQRGLAGARARR
jgi:hypothetical protein